jgi:hypothetical protein
VRNSFFCAHGEQRYVVGRSGLRPSFWLSRGLVLNHWFKAKKIMLLNAEGGLA